MCGSELSAVDEQALISDPGREWRIGEAIAYRDSRQKLRYGRVKRITPGGADAAGMSRVLIQRFPEDSGVYMISHSFSAFRFCLPRACAFSPFLLICILAQILGQCSIAKRTRRRCRQYIV
jgi:hypothetical protein